jgi:hypothetical protein
MPSTFARLGACPEGPAGWLRGFGPVEFSQDGRLLATGFSERVGLLDVRPVPPAPPCQSAQRTPTPPKEGVW